MGATHVFRWLKKRRAAQAEAGRRFLGGTGEARPVPTAAAGDGLIALRAREAPPLQAQGRKKKPKASIDR